MTLVYRVSSEQDLERMVDGNDDAEPAYRKGDR